jgi:hypothetical protein
VGSLLLFAFRRVDLSGDSLPASPPAPAVEHPYRVVLVQSAAFWIATALFAVSSFAFAPAAGMPNF